MDRDIHQPHCVLPSGMVDQLGLLRVSRGWDRTWPEGTEAVYVALGNCETAVSAMVGGNEMCLGRAVLSVLMPDPCAWLVPGPLAAREGSHMADERTPDGRQ